MTADFAIIWYINTTKGQQTMTATRAHLDGNARHQAKLDRIIIQPYADEGQRIRAAAANAGLSVQAYILGAVRQRMEQEKEADQAKP